MVNETPYSVEEISNNKSGTSSLSNLYLYLLTLIGRLIRN